MRRRTLRDRERDGLEEEKEENAYLRRERNHFELLKLFRRAKSLGDASAKLFEFLVALLGGEEVDLVEHYDHGVHRHAGNNEPEEAINKL